ncbi:penicillin-insensitive murein endopeptidase [Pseudohoeflea coraliihabitans]|uniref:penicillin-insensitive murein endopeptidase n=1 Tax=Pseudohoeflea coraliihabitans TaxID=2860393 RepID=UPI003D17E6FC
MNSTFILQCAGRLALIGTLIAALTAAAAADNAVPAKQLFGAASLPASLPAQPYGFYTKGCLAGGVALPTDGPTWQAMRLSRNRRWGHPDMIALVERLSREAAAEDGWPGLLVGDIAQPRGGPMTSGHASHQLGLDADIWLNPMPAQRYTKERRESVSAVSMLKEGTLHVDPEKWTTAHARLLLRAASYPQVQRIFVHPGIKKKLCDTWEGDRTNLGKLRPYWGHHYHFHIRMRCPDDAVNCRPQAGIGNGDGCGKSLAWWFGDEPWKPAEPPKKGQKPKPKPEIRLADLPGACARVIDAGAPPSAAAATYGIGYANPPELREQSGAAPVDIPVPTPRPKP